MADFLFWGAPGDMPAICAAVFSSGMRLVATNANKGRVVRYSRWDSRLARHLEGYDLLFVEGSFTVDLRLEDGDFVSKRSGPLLSLRRPSMRALKELVLKFRVPPVERPKGELEFKSGLLHAEPRYYHFTAPKGSTRDFDAEAKAAYRSLVKGLKEVLVEFNGRWIGANALKWALEGPAIFV